RTVTRGWDVHRAELFELHGTSHADEVGRMADALHGLGGPTSWDIRPGRSSGPVGQPELASQRCRAQRGLGAVAKLELAQQARHVVADGLLGDEQARGDLTVRE